ncbi:peptide chain release factor 1 [Candidatus Aerophobetes bacterium]|uniref:Peptide chain release factor 1 n=1 Tax=Aerophobetes bacterium TaxID=2030807 RepID=A0A2A4X089_UNCAE|nr:MAG: peptide chain release factor 1 [Candidatus Aerophobetes bacterium]
MEQRIKKLLDKYACVEEQLSSQDVLQDQKRFKLLSQEYSYLVEVKKLWDGIEKKRKSLEDSKSLLKSESDEEFQEVIREDITFLKEGLESDLKDIHTLLVPPEPNDSANVIVELRAGTGGDEAAIFVGDCVRMYRLYADSKKWKVETLSLTSSEAGGYKEIILSIQGKNVYRFMQYEAGTHRVQRVPVTETQGRVHTSAITMAVLLEPKEAEKIEVDERDLKIDTYRASGAGGQHINTTDSAVRITHLPTGVVVYCQQERSQHKNKAQALRVLSAKLADRKREEELKERADQRSSQIGSGDRSERIRTYNFPQNRLTDHRIGLTLYKLGQIMEGRLDEVIGALIAHFYAKKLQSVEED